MNDNLLESFLKEDCDQHVKMLLIAAIDANKSADRSEDFSFNRFNIHLDFARQEASVIDDLNPSDGACRVSLAIFRTRVANAAKFIS